MAALAASFFILHFVFFLGANAGSRQAFIATLTAEEKAEQEEMHAQGKLDLDKIKEKEGVLYLPSKPERLAMKLLRVGSGDSAPLEDSYCDVNYVGTTMRLTEDPEKKHHAEWKEFVSTPTGFSTFRPKDYIEGFRLAMLFMQEGDLWELYLPAPLAYDVYGVTGDNGTKLVKGGEMVIFRVELLKIHGERRAASQCRQVLARGLCDHIQDRHIRVNLDKELGTNLAEKARLGMMLSDSYKPQQVQLADIARKELSGSSIAQYRQGHLGGEEANKAAAKLARIVHMSKVGKQDNRFEVFRKIQVLTEIIDLKVRDEQRRKPDVKPSVTEDDDDTYDGEEGAGKKKELEAPDPDKVEL